MFNLLLLLIVSVKFIYCEEASGAKQNYKDVVFTYPSGVRSERDIPVCPSTNVPVPQFPKAVLGTTAKGHESSEDHTEEEIKQRHEGETACNLIHKRYFFPPIVERLCRCPDRSECPWHWSQGPSYPNPNIKHANQSKQEKQQQVTTTKTNTPGEKGGNVSTGAGGGGGGGSGSKRDPNTILINNRSQLKFCNEVTTLPRCKGKNPSLYRIIKTVKLSSTNQSTVDWQTTNVTCYCPPLYRHWIFVAEDTQEFVNGSTTTIVTYRCDKLPKCASMEKCGHIRQDYHSTFYHCSCPPNHLCLPQNEQEIEVDEIFYSGPATQAFCTPFK